MQQGPRRGDSSIQQFGQKFKIAAVFAGELMPRPKHFFPKTFGAYSMLVDLRGLSLVARLSGGQIHESRLLMRLVESLSAVKAFSERMRKRLGNLDVDRAYASHRFWPHWQSISARIARYGVESCERLGRWRWVVERILGLLHSI